MFHLLESNVAKLVNLDLINQRVKNSNKYFKSFRIFGVIIQT